MSVLPPLNQQTASFPENKKTQFFSIFVKIMSAQDTTVAEMKKMGLRPPEMSDYIHDLYKGLHAPVTFCVEELETFPDVGWDMQTMVRELKKKGLRPTVVRSHKLFQS